MQRQNPRSLTPNNHQNKSRLSALPDLSLPRMAQSPKLARRRPRSRSNKKGRNRGYVSLNNTEVSNIHSLLNERTNKSRNRQSHSRDHYKYAVNRSKNDEKIMGSSSQNFLKQVKKRTVGKLRRSYDKAGPLERIDGSKKIGNLEKKIMELQEKKAIKDVKSYGGMTSDEEIGVKIYQKFKGKIFENQSDDVKDKLMAICARFISDDHTMTEDRFENFCRLVVNGFFAGILMKQSEILYKPSGVNLTFPRKRKKP